MPFKYEAYGKWPPRALLSGALPTPGRPARLHSETVVFPAARMALWQMPEKYSTQAHGGGGHTLPPPHPWAPLSPASASWGSQTTFKSGSSPFYTLLYQEANSFLCAYINNTVRWASSRALSHSPKRLGPKEVSGLHRAANGLGP